jgi:4-hydroxy-2-oxoheptanedioate aldolase
MNSLDEILVVPDIDALLIGPHDLSINMGIPEQYDHPLFEAAVQKVIQNGRNAGVGVGMHYSGFDAAEKLSAWAKSGMNMIVYSSDLRLVGNKLKQDIASFRMELGDVDFSPASAENVDLNV